MKSTSCFKTERHILIWNPITFPDMLIYDTQLKNLTDLNDNYKIWSYFHKSVTKWFWMSQNA